VILTGRLLAGTCKMPKDWTKDSWKNSEWRDKDLAVKKMVYNEGHELETAATSAWDTRYRRGTPYTDAHTPCGYWRSHPASEGPFNYRLSSQYHQPGYLYILNGWGDFSALGVSSDSPTMKQSNDGNLWTDIWVGSYGINAIACINPKGELWGTLGVWGQTGSYDWTYTHWGTLASETPFNDGVFHQEPSKSTDWLCFQKNSGWGIMCAVKTDGSIWYGDLDLGLICLSDTVGVDTAAIIREPLKTKVHFFHYWEKNNNYTNACLVIDSNYDLWERSGKTGGVLTKQDDMTGCIAAWGGMTTYHTNLFVQRDDGRLFARGNNATWRLMFPTNNYAEFDPWTEVEDPLTHYIQKLTTNYSGTAILTEKDRVYATGADCDWKFGVPTNEGLPIVLEQEITRSRWLDINASGYYNSIGLREDRKATLTSGYYFGYNDDSVPHIQTTMPLEETTNNSYFFMTYAGSMTMLALSDESYWDFEER